MDESYQHDVFDENGDFNDFFLPRKLPEGTEQFTLLLVGGANGLCDTIRLREVPLGFQLWKGAEKVKQQKWF